MTWWWTLKGKSRSPTPPSLLYWWFVRGHWTAREELTALHNLKSPDLDRAHSSPLIPLANKMDKPLQVNLRNRDEEETRKKTGGEQRAWNSHQGGRHCKAQMTAAWRQGKAFRGGLCVYLVGEAAVSTDAGSWWGRMALLPSCTESPIGPGTMAGIMYVDVSQHLMVLPWG